MTNTAPAKQDSNEKATGQGREGEPSGSAPEVARRTNEQNKLQRKWMKEIGEQLGMTPEEARGYCKLTLGVPILREDNPDFREKYDTLVRPLPYEQKLALMMEPFDFSVTRLMTTAQKTEYLDQINRHFAEQGCRLTQPEERR